MIKDYLKKQELDIRKRGKLSRPFDQKLTPDVVYTVCSVIYELTKDKKTYTNKEIIESDELSKRASEEFGKPIPKEETMNEYDKFVGQPTQMLIYAGIVERLDSRHYKVVNAEVLESIINKNIISAKDFLYLYFKEVLKQSEFKDFDEYLNKTSPTTGDYILLRDSFINLIHENTNIKGRLEPRRIISKVLNLIAYVEKKHGAILGSSSKRVILLSDILYARDNKRDKWKQKDIPRRSSNHSLKNLNTLKSLESKVKRYVKELSNNLSDVSKKTGTQAHHILMKSEYPEFVSTPENIIILTPDEHFLKAHPNNNTQKIDKDYQLFLLKLKFDIIKKNPLNYNMEVFESMLKAANINLS